ncbi:hypothetical protein N7495_001051 [Penicillium taxi]|uniref:uncharacterized protein n=1 Tax=Penicillium taxi TaxID=168475 RepID=UPI0025453276|nr:uncharacterized protein N7495_001051 [Penicillium taxi]KAJ5908369.1 hypothetical protein N7495_001051 [Penicillium taxi]
MPDLSDLDPEWFPIFENTFRPFKPGEDLSVVDPATRVEELREFLARLMKAPAGYKEYWQINVDVAIKMYQNGELGPFRLGDPPVYFVDGKMVDKNPWKDDTVPATASRWCEIPARMRIPLRANGNSTIMHNIIMYNDTGSNVLTVFASDLQRQTLSADGANYQTSLSIEIQVQTTGSEEFTPWFEENCVFRRDDPSTARLSGAAMRDHLYFATTPGNQRLYVAQKKTRLFSILPA